MRFTSKKVESHWLNNSRSCISAGNYHIVGLKLDGTVAAIGCNTSGQCNVKNWQNIVAVTAGGGHTIGLKPDGTVVAVGNNIYGECNVQDWRNIAAVSTGIVGFITAHTVGLRADGTVAAVGCNSDGQCQSSRLAGYCISFCVWLPYCGLKIPWHCGCGGQ